MRVAPAAALLLCAGFGTVLPVSAQVREDAIWARVADGPITLDGVLNESDWDEAESMTIEWAQDAGIPGSGWKVEGGVAAEDPTFATLKFLVVGNQLYLGAVVEDASVGGSPDFNRFDGFLMSVKDHADPNFPKPPAEYLYGWWYPEDSAPLPPGQDPGFIGRWATWPPGTPRDPEQIENWDAVTVVNGLSNDDSVLDQTYTVEMRFNLTPMGYDVTQPEGDIVEWNISIYDCDWLWPLDAGRLSYNRVWWQGPWGNAAWYNEVRVYSRPDVTVSSGLVPPIEPEAIIPEADMAPVIDGVLSDPVWTDPDLYTFDIRYGDVALRDTYPGVGKFRAGQFQPVVNGGQAFVIDPGDATVKVFFMDQTLYFGFDVRDRVVQHVVDFDRWDGFLIGLVDRGARGPDNQLLGRRLSFQVAQNGTALPQDYLNTLVVGGDAEVAIALNPGTTVDTLGQQADNGYTAELALDLAALGYPVDLGDGALFFGVNLLDGDSFTPFTDSYGTRTWWFREYENDCCSVWARLDIPIIEVDPITQPPDLALLQAFPNPAPRPTIQYQLREPSGVTLEVYDVRGRLVEQRDLGVQGTGVREVVFDGTGRSAGLYLYRLRLADPVTGAARSTPYGKMVILN